MMNSDFCARLSLIGFLVAVIGTLTVLSALLLSNDELLAMIGVVVSVFGAFIGTTSTLFNLKANQ